MNTTELDNALSYFQSQSFIGTIFVSAVGFLLLFLIKKYLIKKVAYTGKDSQHMNTFIGVVFNIMQYIVVVIMAILILQLHGVNVASILAGLGIMSAIIGLSLQDTLKDIFSGINIYVNNFYKVGDMVRWNDEDCNVKYFSARVTKFQSINTNSTYTVCNSLITSIEKVKDRHIITYYFPFETEKARIDECMDYIAKRCDAESEHINLIYYDGIAAITQEGVSYQLKYSCPAHKYEEVGDLVAGVAYEEFHNFGIRPLFNIFNK